MKKLFLLFAILVASFTYSTAQQPSTGSSSRANLTLRPNSRDYVIIRQGNNHQRMIQLRSQAMLRHKQALMNRKIALEHRQALIRKQMMRQKNIHQRMVQQRGRHK